MPADHPKDAVRRIYAEGHRATPALLHCLAEPRTAQQARLAALFRATAAAKRRGVKNVAVRVEDLEMLILVAAMTDAGVVQ